jgi:lysyl-tRNA synthetase class 2
MSGFELPETRRPWQPTCSINMLRLRAVMLSAIRQFFDQRGYLEVETPLLSHDIVVDAHLEPFAVLTQPNSDSPAFLQTSPEAGMKRLLAAGSGSIYQITRSFRRSEFGRRHNPEFTIVEWYGIDSTYTDQMTLTQQLIHAAVNAVRQSQIDNPNSMPAEQSRCEALCRPFSRTRYADVFQTFLNCDVLDASVQEIRQLAEAHTTIQSSAVTDADRDDLLNVLLAERIEPSLGSDPPEFLYDYPSSQAALAEFHPTDARTACRFELYCRGLELCNGYQELTDPVELRRREKIQNATRIQHTHVPLPGAHMLDSAMTAGLPRCSGVALGFDRLVMCVTGADHIDQVIPFPFDRA